MKTFTASQKQAVDKGRLKLAYLVEITLQGTNPPTLYLSDRNITVGGQIYECYLANLSGLREEIERATSEGLNPDITLEFLNDKYKTNNHLIELGDTYPFEGAVTIIKEVYIDDNDELSDTLTIFKGTLDEPQDIDLLKFKCSLSSMPTVKDEQFKQALIIKFNTGGLWGEQSNPKNEPLFGIAWNGSIFCAVGSSDGATAYIATSPDGVVWTARSFANTFFNAITWNGSIFCAVGKYIATSPDGINWTARSSYVADLYGIAWNGSVFCAVGLTNAGDAYILTSPDGITWTERSNPKNFHLYGIVWNGSIFCAVGDRDTGDAYILTSPDGTSWTERSNPKNKDLRGIVWNGSIFCAVGLKDGFDAYILTSPDGITWTERSNPKSKDLYGIAWNGSVFCAVGQTDDDTYILTSPDGAAWTERNSPKNIQLNSIVWGNSQFVAVGEADGTDAYILTSPDGGVSEAPGYPNADPDDINKIQNIIYGSCERVRCHAIKAGAMDNLTEDISDSDMSFDLSDASEFPSSGSFTVQIDNEKMLIASRSGNTLTVTTRGYGSTTATEHSAGAPVFEVLTEYIYLLAAHPVKAIGDIYVDGIRQTTNFTKYTGQSGDEHADYPEKAIIKFTAKPVISKQVNIDVNTNDTIDVDSNSQSTLKINPSGGQTELRDGSLATYYDAFNGIMTYPGTSYGTMQRRRHCVHVENLHATTTKTLKIALSWDEYNYVTINIPPGVKTTVYAQYGGSNWTEGTKCVGEDSNVRIYEVWKEVDYVIAVNKTGTVTATATGNSSADVVVGASVNADVDGYQDDGSGTYTGSANALIERPDHVLKHFIDVLYGFSLSDINTSSFSTAGASYAGAISGGYKFAFLINEEIKPSKFLANLAFQCRSCLRYEASEWYLDYLPDTAPSAVKTISKADIAGKNKKFIFSKTLRVDIVNDLTAKFQKNYERLKFDESEWLETAYNADSTSQTNYGIRPKDYEFWAIRIQLMADHVLAFLKLQRKNPLLLIEFPVFWEHFDLERGDTFDISNDLYDAEKFYIEKIKKLDKFKLQITGIEWP